MLFFPKKNILMVDYCSSVTHFLMERIFKKLLYSSAVKIIPRPRFEELTVRLVRQLQRCSIMATDLMGANSTMY